MAAPTGSVAAITDQGDGTAEVAAGAHGRSIGDVVIIASAGDSSYDTTHTVTGIPDANTFNTNTEFVGISVGGTWTLRRSTSQRRLITQRR